MEPDSRRRPLEAQRFEDVYPQYEFAPLVRLALTATQWMKRHLEKKPQHMRSEKPQAVTGMKPIAR